MAQKGLVYYSSHWGCDVTKIRQKLAEIKLTISRSRVNPLLKDDMLKDIESAIALLNKGRVRSESCEE